MKIRGWLQFFRIHTASAELGGLGIAAYLAGVRGFGLVPIMLFAILWHATGFGENSLLDWVHGYDRNDPSKAHHPLNTGTIRQAEAKDVVITMHILGIVFFIGMMLLYHTRAAAASLLLFALAILFGNIYNFYGKRNKWAAAVEISLTFSLLTAAVFFMANGAFGPLPLLLFLYAFFYVFFQIAQMGEAKELGQMNERNLLRRMGSYVDADGVYHISAGNNTFMWALTFIKGGLLIAAVSLVYASQTAFAVMVLLIALVLVGYSFGFQHITTRKEALKVMGAGEALSYVILVPAIISVAQWPYVLLLILLPMGWFVLLNKATWGTILAPQV